MISRVLLAGFIILSLSDFAWAVTRYADNQLPSGNCTTGNYNRIARDCTGADGDAYTTPSGVIGVTAAGDQICVRSGTIWTQQWDFQAPNKSGTSTNYIRMGGCDGEIPTLRYADSSTLGYGPIKARGNRGYFIFENMILDGSASTDGSKSGFAIRDGNHHFILRNLEIKNFKNVSGVYIMANDITVQDCTIHDQYSPSGAVGTRHYAIYYFGGNRNVIERNDFYNNDGGGMQLAPGPIDGATVRYNRIHDNNRWPDITVGGMKVRTSVADGGGPITNVDIYGNNIYNNGSDANSGTAYGLQLESTTVSNVRVHNNVIYGNKTGGLTVNGPTTGIDIRNTLLTGNGGTELIVTGGGVATISHSACTGAESCGATNKTTLTTGIGDCVSNAATADFRLKQGTNPCRDAGTPVSTRPISVDAVDIGSYEQGRIVSAVSTGGFIEVTVNALGGVQPTSGITQFTVANGTSTGTPAVTSSPVKPGSTNVVQLAVSGFTGSGTCTISYGAGNMADSNYVGPSSLGFAQGVNSVTGLTVSNTCTNSAGGAPPTTPYLYYKLNDGSGTNANDDTVNNRDGTLSGSPTWTTPAFDGYGIYFPSDGVDRRLTSPYGSGVNPSTTSFTVCRWVKADAGISNKVVTASAVGTNQRYYVGTYTGQTWQLGVQTSAYSATGESEFPVTTSWARLCMVADSTIDTITLAVNGIAGTSSAAKKTHTSFTLASNIVDGCGFSGTTYCGGYTIDEAKIWDRALSSAELLEDFESYTPPGASVGGYAEVTHRCQRVYLTGANGSPINIGSVGQAECVLQDGGAIALEVMLKCTGGDCAPVAVRPHATDNLGNTSAVPQSLGSLGLWMWGDSTDPHLNKGVSTCCMSGSFVAVNGVTILDSIASNTIDLADGEATQVRWIFRCGQDSQDKTYTIEIKQDNSAALSGAAGTTPTLRCVAPTATGGF